MKAQTQIWHDKNTFPKKDGTIVFFDGKTDFVMIREKCENGNDCDDVDCCYYLNKDKIEVGEPYFTSTYYGYNAEISYHKFIKIIKDRLWCYLDDLLSQAAKVDELEKNLDKEKDRKFAHEILQIKDSADKKNDRVKSSENKKNTGSAEATAGNSCSNCEKYQDEIRRLQSLLTMFPERITDSTMVAGKSIWKDSDYEPFDNKWIIIRRKDTEQKKVFFTGKNFTFEPNVRDQWCYLDDLLKAAGV